MELLVGNLSVFSLRCVLGPSGNLRRQALEKPNMFSQTQLLNALKQIAHFNCFHWRGAKNSEWPCCFWLFAVLGELFFQTWIPPLHLLSGV